MSIHRLPARSRGLRAVLAAAGFVFLSGCPGGGYSGPTGTVSGTVTLDGEPVPQGCTVAFVSDQGFAASGQLGAGGKYKLSVAGKGNEIPVATYKVTVTPSATGQMSDQDYEKMMQESASGGEKPKAESKPAEEVIPAKYSSTATSGLSFNVKKGPNTIDIKLE